MKGFVFKFKRRAVNSLKLVSSLVGAGYNCVVCGKTCVKAAVCENCDKKFFDVTKEVARCRLCGKQLVSERDLCMECRNEPVLKSTDGVFPLFSYRLWNSYVMTSWKLKGDREFSEFFAWKVAQRIELLKRKSGNFVLVPVPPRPGKIKEKGWDQVQDLCRYLKFMYGYEIWDLLVRFSSEETKHLDKEQRLNSIESAYGLKETDLKISGSYCIIDDVITTGSTIECCARLLKQAGAEKVYSICLYRVDS